MVKKISAMLALALAGVAAAQTVPVSPKLFGINYWYYDYAGGFDAFNQKKDAVKAAGINLVRLGGLLPQTKLQLADMAGFDIAIDRVNSIGATPLLQLPINLAAADIPLWIEHFRAKGITYWSIGNEPEPTSNFAAWFKGTPLTPGGPLVREHGNTYAEFRDKFVALARAVKQADPQAVVIGPDFHQFYGTTQAADPLMSYYPAFIADVGALSEGGAPLLDIFAFHYYGYNPDLDNKKRFDVFQSYLNGVNQQRARPLRMAVGEVNATPSTNPSFNPSLLFPWDFEAGQFIVSIVKNAVANGAEFVAPWSVYESSGSKGATDFSTFNANGTPRSTMVHVGLLANNRRAYQMNGSQSGAGGNSVVQFGMTDAGGSTVALMNTTTLARTYSVRLDGSYSNANANTRFLFSSTNLNPVEWVGNLPAKTTLLFTVDANGKRLKKIEFNKAISDAAQTNAASVPLQSDLTVGAAVSLAAGVVTLSAVLPPDVARTKADFYVDGQFAGSSAQAPLTLQSQAATLQNGEHKLEVDAYDTDGNVDRSAPVMFTIANPVDMTASVATASSGLILNRATGAFNGRITVTNTSGAALSGPLQLSLRGLTAGVGLLNAAGTREGAPYVLLGESLAPGAAVTVPLSFANPARLAVRYTPAIYSGNF